MRAAVCVFLLAVAGRVGAKTIYVDADAAGSGTGANWANAYRYLQDALVDANSSAKPVEIRVGQGTYTPDANSADPNGSGDRTATFQLINDVNLRGGYAGDGEPDPNDRDIDNYETILSGDLDGNDVQVLNPSDLLTEPTRAENSYRVVTGSGTDVTAVLDGFTITAGNADGADGIPWHEEGGGMNISKGSPLITNCTFINNSASDDGGGVYNVGTYGLDDGPILTNCTFFRNAAASRGGGISYYHGSRKLVDCTFGNNWAAKGGGGMFIRWSSPTLTNSTFIGNYADGAGGGAIRTMVLVGHTPEFTNCIFSGNSASTDGGAIVTTHDYSIFTNCTFSENSAGADGGVYSINVNGGTPDFNNCILWGNTANGSGDQIAIKTSFATVSVNYSDVEGGNSPSAVYVESGTLNWGSGNLNEDPLFVDADGPDNTAGTEDDDLHLLADSNCIDAGDNTALPADTTDLDDDANTAEPVPYDLDGNPRIIDSNVDMGAYETRPFIYVDTDAAGSNDGTNWANAYNYLQDALSAAKGGWGEIRVAEGTYKPDQGSEVTAGDRSATFQLKSGIDLTGGYAGSGEPDPNERNINTYQTILSGDLDGNDVPITDPCELEDEPSRAENSYHVVTGADNVTR
jgi:predicted outer membrane repeat protein